MAGEFAKRFHKELAGRHPHIPQDRAQWPQEWGEVSYKRYPRFLFTPLPTAKQPTNMALEEALLSRRSSAALAGGKHISIEELSALLFYSVGLHGDEQPHKTGTTHVGQRPYPSGGGRYPLEFYLGIRDMPNTPAGIYHYDIRRHGLEQIGNEFARDELTEALAHPWGKEAPLIVLITAVWERSLMKYQDPGYTLILLEAGHAAQNILLAATALYLRTCPMASFSQEEVDTLLDIQYTDEETAIYTIALGGPKESDTV